VKAGSKRATAGVAKRNAAAAKGWETRRRKAAAAEKKRRERARKRAETLARKAAEKERRREAARRGYARRLARERAQAALETFVSAVDRRVPEREIRAVKESWHREKAALENAYGDDYERFLGILDELADAEGTEWDIAYGGSDSAA
jgi:hypothetical protein